MELAPTNARVWMSKELGNRITSKYRAAFGRLAHASSRFRPLPPRYREAFACRLPSSFVSSKKKKPHPRAQGQAAGEACAQDPAAGEARARLGGRTTGGGPLHLHGRARVGHASPPPLPCQSPLQDPRHGGRRRCPMQGRRRPEPDWRRRGPPPSSSHWNLLLPPPLELAPDHFSYLLFRRFARTFPCLPLRPAGRPASSPSLSNAASCAAPSSPLLRLVSCRALPCPPLQGERGAEGDGEPQAHGGG